MQSAVRSGIKKNNLCFCTKPRLKALGLEEQVVFPHLGGPGAEGQRERCSGHGDPSPLPGHRHRFPSAQWKLPQSLYLEAVSRQRAEKMRTDERWL